MLTIISGALGSGKTLFLVLRAYMSERNIVSNFSLYGLNKEIFSIVKFMKSEYVNCDILIDEFYRYIDARNSMSNMNKLSSYTLFQSRKKSINVYGTVQLESTLDLRFRDLADYYITALGLVRIKGNLMYKYRLRFVDNNGKFKYSYGYIPLDIAEMLYNLYDTNEVIQLENDSKIIDEFKTPDEIIKEIEKIGKEMSKIYELKDITHDKVQWFLLKHKKDVRLEPYVYVEVRELLEGNI